MTNSFKRNRQFTRNKYKAAGDHNEFLERITKSLYYGSLPPIPSLSFPLTELSVELFSEVQKGKTLRRLNVEDAAELTHNACISPCSLVLALLYLERLKSINPEYVLKAAPSELFLISLMVSNKFLHDDGEEDEVLCEEWASSAGISLEELHSLERDFLHAIDWRIFVNEQLFESGLERLEHEVAIRQAKLRGWFTYADLTNITSTLEIISLMKCLFTVCIALSVSYLACVSTLVASSLIASHASANLTKVFSSVAINSDSIQSAADHLTNNSDYGSALDDVDSEKLHIDAYQSDIVEKLIIFNKHFNLYNNETFLTNNGRYMKNLYDCNTVHRLRVETINDFLETIMKAKTMELILKFLKCYIIGYEDGLMDGDMSTRYKNSYLTNTYLPPAWSQENYPLLRHIPSTFTLRC